MIGLNEKLKQRGWVLVFDERDSLLYKRREVYRSEDCYLGERIHEVYLAKTNGQWEILSYNPFYYKKGDDYVALPLDARDLKMFMSIIKRRK